MHRRPPSKPIETVRVRRDADTLRNPDSYPVLPPEVAGLIRLDPDQDLVPNDPEADPPRAGRPALHRPATISAPAPTNDAPRGWLPADERLPIERLAPRASRPALRPTKPSRTTPLLVASVFIAGLMLGVGLDRLAADASGDTILRVPVRLAGPGLLVLGLVSLVVFAAWVYQAIRALRAGQAGLLRQFDLIVGDQDAEGYWRDG